jgi:hypothetical protein
MTFGNAACDVEELRFFKQRCENILSTLLEPLDKSVGSSSTIMNDDDVHLKNEIVKLELLCDNLSLDVSEMERQHVSVASEYALLLAIYERKCITLRATKGHNAALQLLLDQANQRHEDISRKLYTLQCAYARYLIKDSVS